MEQQLLIVYPFLPHYRSGVFLELDSTPGLKVLFASDIRGRSGIRVMDSSQLKSFLSVRTKRWRGIEFQPEITTLISCSRFDAVIFLGDVSSISTWMGAAIARLRGMRVFFWTIGWHRPDRGAKRLVRLAFYRLAHSLLLYGNIGRELGITMGYPAERMVVIGNSTSLSSLGEPTPRCVYYHSHDQAIRVGAVARITATKRFDLLIEACAVLRRRGLNAIIKLAGDGPALKDLQRLAQELGVPLELIPPIYSPIQLTGFYSNLDATVVPQAIGLTVIQSLGYGVPSVSDDNAYTQMPEWQSIIPGVTGELYSAGSVESLADAILRASKLRKSVKCSEACRAEYEGRWSPSIHARNIRDAIGLL